MNEILMNEFRKEKNISIGMQFHSGGLWADYIEWLEKKLERSDNSDYTKCSVCGENKNKVHIVCGDCLDDSGMF